MLVTVRIRDGVPSLRSRLAFPVVEAAVLGANTSRSDFAVCEFTALGNHLHLVVEADSSDALARGMQSLSVRLARRLNRACGRRGAVLSDRYHVHVLRTPSEVRNALAYVLLNHRSHRARWGERVSRTRFEPDLCSSAAWFDGWDERDRGPARSAPERTRVTAPARSWLLRAGWRRCGLISATEVPASQGREERMERSTRELVTVRT